MAVTHTRDNPYLESIYAPISNEVTLQDFEIEGEIPRDLNGAFVRNGPNPRQTPRGRHHWFDGDAMLHAMHFDDGKATYRNKWIQTPHFQMETESQRPLWGGLMEPFSENPKVGLFKDTANTDVLYHNGKLLALWYLSGNVMTVNPDSLETQGPTHFEDTFNAKMSAHAKVDPQTGELLFFGFGMKPPFMFYGEIGVNGKLQYQCPVELPGPRLPHDMAFTENYAILMDLPVFYNMESLAKGRWKSEFHPNMPSRFALVPRHKRGGDVRWFEADPGYIYHTINAWEEGDEVVMTACMVDQPINPRRQSDGEYAQMMANLRVSARLQQWRFNLQTGDTKVVSLCDRNTEFPSVNLTGLGKKSQFSYNMCIADTPTLLFDGIAKYNIETGQSVTHVMDPGMYASEAPFAPADNASTEDHGYLVSFVRGGPGDVSEVHILDARQIEAGPVAKIRIPEAVPIGFHATWVTAEQLGTN